MALRFVAAFLLPRGLAKKVKKCYGCGDMFEEKFRLPAHNIVVKHVDRCVVRRDDNTGALVYNSYYHPETLRILGE